DEYTPGAPSSASTSRPVSSANAGRPVARHSASAFSRAFSNKVEPVSSTSGTSAGRGTNVTDPPAMASISRALSGLAVARTSFKRLRPSGARRGRLGQHAALLVEDGRDAVLGQAEQVVELRSAEGRALGRPLHLDEASRR